VILYRSADGYTIHAGRCRRRGAALRWVFADDRNASQVRDAMATAPWLKECKVCRPLDRTPNDTGEDS
jgi:hypothetical protein